MLCEMESGKKENNRPDSGHNDVVTPSSSTSSPESNSCELHHQAAIADNISDEIYYTQLDESFAMEKILSKKVSFQGENVPVKDLVGTKPEELLSIHSIDELLRSKEGEIKIPSFGSSHFEESLYIKRRVKLAFNEHFIADLANRLRCTKEQLNGICRITSQGQIKWLVDGERRQNIWKEIKEMKDQTLGKIEEDGHLIQLDEEPTEHPVVIICGVAGTGKSTFLSHYYNEIKKKSGCWVIKLNLVEHSDAILKFDTNKPDFIRFLINDIHVVDSKCPFSCWLLNHRFETGEQIVFMFDGYDEIGKECQEIAIQMMKSIQKKGIQLYVTTRSHVALHLQYELCQLAYYLENFNKEDQISCLAKYWKKTLELPDGVQDGVHDRVQKMKIKKIEVFAELLVDRVSDTLKDEERAFIGIPLQCIILAECYQKNVGDIVEINAVDDEQLVSAIKEQFKNEKFDLVSLFSQVMDTKREIFRGKANNTMSNQVVANSFDSGVETIDGWLTKLAVETIITEPNILEMFWPTKFRDESSEDVARKEKSHAIDSLIFGLTFSNGDGMRPKFLHRTFAEYLVAKYLYEGFHPDDKHHNKLLVRKSIRKLILNKILASAQYDGVQMFFDCMVKTLVDDMDVDVIEEKKKWRYIIDNRQLPGRLSKLTKNLYTQFLRDFHPYVNALHFSLSNGKGNIFLMLCDCLDATFEKQQIHWAMCTSFISSDRFILSPTLKESKFFKRFISYFADSRYPSACSVIDTLIKRMFPCDCDFMFGRISFGKRDGYQETMNDLLQFLEDQHVAFDKYLCEEKTTEIKTMLVYFFCDDNYRSHMERFLKLLSKSKTYKHDIPFAEVLREVFRAKAQVMPGRIAETLKILQELGRSTLLVELYGVVLSKEPEAFQNIYQPRRLEKQNAMTIDLDILLKRDEYGMTPLHGAAFYGDVEIVGQILARFRQPDIDDGDKKAICKVVFQNSTPFYVAAAKNHEQVCSKLLAFVKDFFPDALTRKLTKFESLNVTNMESLLNITQEQFFFSPFVLSKDKMGKATEVKESIYRSLYHAVKSANAGMFQLMLKVFKNELGHDYLFDLLLTGPFLSTMWLVMLGVTERGKFFIPVANVVVNRDCVTTNDTNVDYKCLNDFIFFERGIQRDVLECMDAEHLQGLLSVEGAGPFTKRLLTDNLERNFHLLSTYFLRNFNEKQLLDFVRMITLKGDNRNSFWGDFLRQHNDETIVFYIFECVSDKLGGDYAEELLLHQDDRGYVFLHLSQEIVKRMLNCLPQKNKEEIKKEWKEKAPPMTHDSFINQNSKGKLSSVAIAKHYSDILLFYLDHGSEMQLSRCVDILTSVRSLKGKQRSVWSYIFEHCEVTRTNEILKIVSVILGWETVLLLLFHEMDGFPLVLKAVSWGDDIDGRLDLLPQELRNVIQQDIKLKAADFIDQVFRDHKIYFKATSEQCYKRLNTLLFLINYSNAQQLEQFVENITTLQVPTRTEKTLSLWAEMFTHQCDEAKTNTVAKMDTFLKCVSEKLGTGAVKKLVFHNINDNPVTYYPTVRGEEKMVAAMLAHLDAKNRKKIQRQVNEVLKETFKVPRRGVLTAAMKKAYKNL